MTFRRPHVIIVECEKNNISDIMRKERCVYVNKECE